MDDTPNAMAVDSVCVAITIPDTLSQSEQSSRSGSVRRGSVDLEGSSLSRKRQRLADGEYRDSSQPAEDRVNTSKRPVQQGPSPTIPVPVKKSSHTLRNSPIIRPVLRSDRSLSVASSPGSSTSFQVNEAIIRSIETDAICGSPKIETMRDSGVASKPIHIPSSPSASPEIEAAELEDIEPDLDTVIDIEEDDVSGSQGIEFPRPNFFGGHSNVTHSFRLVRDRLLDFADALSYLQSISQWLSEICLWASHDPELAHNVIYTNPEMFDGPRVLLEGIIHREKGFAGNFIAAGSTVQDGPSILKTFFKEFAEYLKVIFRANQALLLGEVSPELAAASSSPKLYDFLTIVFRTLAKTAPLFETCERRYSIKQDALLEQFADVLVCAQLEGLLDWDQFLDLAQDKGPQQDKVTTYLRIISSMQLSFLRIYSFAESMREADPDAISGKLAGLLQQSRVVYTYLDKHFRQSLSQKMSRVGTANDNLLFINEIERLHQAMCRIDDSVASEFLQRRGLDAGALDDVEARIASDAVLKLDLLRHMIMVGKMDFRVIGIDASAGLLASLYRDRLEIFPVAAEDPILQIIAQFLDKLKLISYLVGSQSHPELTKHSTNIVAFLMVTGRFTPLISDEIWGDMTSTSNPRTRDAIIQLLDDMHGNYQWKDIQHRCLQICQLPPEQMDMRIIRHAFRTLETAIQKARHSTSSYRTTRGMLDLCIKLLRHATAYEASSQLGMDEATWHAARDKLHACLQCNSAPEDLQAVLRECVEDVKSRTITATGSMQAMIIVIQHLRLTQVEIEPVKWLAEHHDLVHLFAAELQGAVKVERSKIGRVAINDMVMSVRLHLLQEIIFEAPASIEGDDERLIMSYFFGEQALADRYRQMFWLQMARFTDTLVTGNQVVDRLRDHYCQHLPGQFIFMEVIEFVAQTIHLDSQLEKHGAIAEDHIIDIPSSDLLWRMIFQAPDDRIAHRAAYILLRSYEDARINRNAPASALTVTYTMIIERCMRNLIDSAQAVPRMYDQNDAKTSEARQVKNVVQFRRALALLQILLSNYRAKEPVKASASGGNSSPELYGGDPLVIRWQASTMKSTSEIESFTINDESPASGLKKRLQIATGFQRFDVFFQGKKFEPDLGLLTDLIKDTPFVSGHLLLVRKTYAPGELEDSGSKLLTKMDLEVLKHFDTLYELFSLPLIYSQHVYDFVQRFPTQERVTSRVLSSDATLSELFEIDKPHKCMYTLECMRAVLNDQLILDQAYVALTFGRLSQALQQVTLGEGHTSEMDFYYIIHLTDAMLQFIKEAPEAAMFGIDDITRTVVVDHLLSLNDFCTAERTLGYSYASRAIINTFALLLDLALNDSILFERLVQARRFHTQIGRFLLLDPRTTCRKHVEMCITGICQVQSRPRATAVKSFVTLFWAILQGLLAAAMKTPLQSTEYFATCRMVLDSLSREGADSLDYDRLIKQWTQLLASHEHDEIIGQPSRDPVVHGLNLLIRSCIIGARSRKLYISLQPLTLVIVNKLLLPQPSVVDHGDRVAAVVPVMDPETRAQLYDTLQQCCVDLKSGHEILALIDSIAAEDTYEDTWVYESGRSLRSCAGYVGTVNLSNTCYSNSLFTQLYMNVPFREFILDLNVSDDDEQRLLRELRKMFADMQYSWQRAYNPENLIGSILNYEGQSIDPNIQMDADEFYNLLFDRLEAQLPTQQTRQAFKRFYGGQLVQQIRSKDCGHVSEREEAFSAIQCEIKNKATLEDSLLAYVQGEVLEGDNKYKCATCDQKVDAVKRSCLKDLPDNLIFHLKRFDFDLRTLTRSKINDVFQFPDAINMTPYTVDQLNDCSQILPLDVFDLVGVLVHSGTAESGHYYSYIRERPTRNIRAPRWLEFNDTEVGTLDFSQLGSQCFGGNEASTLPGFQYPMPKIYSAYMLFYERRSSLESKQNRCQSSGLSIPRIIPLPRELNEVTIEENASILRYHCLHVDAHLEFVRWLIVRLASWKPVDCTSTHDLERFAVGVVLQHLTTVVSRISNDPKNLKARPRHLDEIMTALRHFLSNCPVCHGLVLEWTIDDAVGLESLLLKCPKPPVRDAYRELLCVCLSASRTISEDNLEPNQDYAQWFTGLTGRLYHMWTITVPRFPKSWTEYWRLIAYIARMGTYEAGELLRMGFLSRSMHILGLESIKPLPHEYDNIARGFSRKKAAFAGLVDLTSALIQYIDLSRIQDQSLLDDESRAMNGPNELGKFPLSKSENVLWRSFERNERSRTLKVMDKMLSADITRTEEIDRAIHLFIARLAESDPQTSLPLWVKDTLAEGIYIDPAYLAGPYLQAAVSFCEYCPTEELCQSLFKEVISAFRHMPSLGGEELLHFYKTIIRTRNVCWDGEAAWRMRRLAILHTSDWGLRLLQYTGDPRIREEVDRFLREVIYDGCHPHIEGAPTSVPIVDHDQPTGNEGSGTDHRLATKSAPPSMAFVMPIHQPAPHSSGSLEVEAPSTNEGASSPVNTLVEETGDSEDLRSTADISPSPESTYHEPSGLTSLQKRESARLLYRRLLTSCEYQVSLAITQTNASTPVDGCLPLPTTVGPMNIGLLKIVGTLLSSSMSALQSLGPYIGSDLLESEARAGCAVSPTHAAVVSSAGLVVTAKTWEERAEEICTVVELGLNLAQHADGQASDDDEGDFESDEDVEDDDATTYSN